MNTFKSIVVIAVLGVVAYGVYVTLTEQPAPETPDWLPPEIAGSLSAPDVEMGSATGVPPLHDDSSSGGAAGGDPLAGLGATAAGEAPTTGTPNLDAQGGPRPSAYAQADYGGSSPANASSDPLAAARQAGLAPNIGENPLSAHAAGGPAAGRAPYGTQLASAEQPESVYRRDASQASTDPRDMAAAGGFGKSMEAAQGQLRAGDLPMALLTLSFWYDHPKLTAAEEDQLNKLLDQLAGTVIYSRQSFIEAPHRVSQYERLEDIAKKWEITPRLLAKINAIDPDSRPEQGAELKVVRGPFNATVNVDKQALTLMVGGRYAGRFPMRTSSNFNPGGRQYFVQIKTANPPGARTNGSRDSVPITRRIELASGASVGTAGGELVQIIGCDDPSLLQSSEYANAILLGSKDADDVFDILTEQSRVTIE